MSYFQEKKGGWFFTPNKAEKNTVVASIKAYYYNINLVCNTNMTYKRREKAF